MTIKTHITKQEEAQVEKSVQVRAADPGSPVTNQVWINTTSKTQKFYDGATVQEVGGGGGFTHLTAYVRELQTSGTGGGASIVGVITRTLNTLSGDTGFISISANQITLDPGTYKFRGSCPAYRVSQNRTFVYDITGATTPTDGLGTTTYSATPADSGMTRSFFSWNFTITATNVYEIRHWLNRVDPSGLGTGGASGLSEVYTEVEITKIG